MTWGSLERVSGTGKKEGENVIGLDAEIDMGEIPEAVNGEAGAGKQRQRKRELADDQNTPEEMLTRAGAGASAFFESLGGIDARCIPGGSGTGQKAGHRGGGEGEEQDGYVEAQVRLAGQCIARHGGNEALQHGVTESRPPGLRRRERGSGSPSEAERRWRCGRHRARCERLVPFGAPCRAPAADWRR